MRLIFAASVFRKACSARGKVRYSTIVNVLSPELGHDSFGVSLVTLDILMMIRGTSFTKVIQWLPPVSSLDAGGAFLDEGPRCFSYEQLANAINKRNWLKNRLGGVIQWYELPHTFCESRQRLFTPACKKVDRGPFLRAAVHSKSTFWRKQRPELLKAAAHLIWARQRSQRSSTVHCKGTWDLCEALRALRSNPKLLARSNASA